MSTSGEKPEMGSSVDYSVIEPVPRRREWQRYVVGSRGGGVRVASVWGPDSDRQNG